MKSVTKSNLNEDKKINEMLDEYKYAYNMYVRLSVIKMVKNGHTRGEAAEKFNVHRKTAENWVKAYKKNGLKGLEPNYSNCGLNCKLSDNQLDELKNIVINSGKKYSVNSVRNLIDDKFNVQYTYKQTWFILRKKLGLNIKNGVLVV